MPRDGSGAADNKVSDDPGHSIVHGEGDAAVEVDRSSKAAPAPELEKGEAIEGLGASGGGSSVEGKGEAAQSKN